MYREVVAILSYVAVLPYLLQAQEQITGIVGKSVTLNCDGASEKPERIQWVDWVHNTGRDPMPIFDSTGNPERGINTNHPNIASFVVNEDFGLTLEALKIGDNSDAGEYVCITTDSSGKETEHTVIVNIGGLPQCSGNVELTEGETSLLTCEAPFSGNAPSLTWFMGTEELQSIDMNEINTAKMEYTIAGATHEQDGKTFTCKMDYGGFAEECSLSVTVSYAVRDLMILPEKEEIEVNEEVKCSALGNPKPTIDLELTTEGNANVPVVEGNNFKTFKITKDLQGQKVTVSCTASNTVNGNTETRNKETTYTVVAFPTTTSTTSSTTSLKVEIKTQPPKIPDNDKDKTNEPPPTPKPDTNKPAEAGGNIAGIIAGILIAALVIVVIVIAIVCIRRKNSKKHKGAKPVPTKEEEIKRLEDGKA